MRFEPHVMPREVVWRSDRSLVRYDLIEQGLDSGGKRRFRRRLRLGRLLGTGQGDSGKDYGHKK
ncbi:MAG: hypothetical protein ACYS9X_26560 [Planctomycetota bacterium]